MNWRVDDRLNPEHFIACVRDSFPLAASVYKYGLLRAAELRKEADRG